MSVLFVCVTYRVEVQGGRGRAGAVAAVHVVVGRGRGLVGHVVGGHAGGRGRRVVVGRGRGLGLVVHAVRGGRRVHVGAGTHHGGTPQQQQRRRQTDAHA